MAKVLIATLYSPEPVLLANLLRDKIDNEAYEKRWLDGKTYKYLDFD